MIAIDFLFQFEQKIINLIPPTNEVLMIHTEELAAKCSTEAFSS